MKVSKNYKKIFAVFAALALTVSLFAIPSFAQDGAPDDTDGMHVTEGADGIDDVTDSGTVGNAVSDSDGTSGNETDNVFGSIFSALRENLSEILCALTLIGSIILAVAYKKGLLPILSGAVSAIGKGVGRLQGEAEKFNKESGERICDISDKLTNTAEAISGFSKRLELLEGELTSMNKSSEKFDAILKAISTEAQLLYDVFMSSALPQYQKDAVAKRISEINGTISEV